MDAANQSIQYESQSSQRLKNLQNLYSQPIHQLLSIFTRNESISRSDIEIKIKQISHNCYLHNQTSLFKLFCTTFPAPTKCLPKIPQRQKHKYTNIPRETLIKKRPILAKRFRRRTFPAFLNAVFLPKALGEAVEGGCTTKTDGSRSFSRPRGRGARALAVHRCTAAAAGRKGAESGQQIEKRNMQQGRADECGSRRHTSAGWWE